jgi:Flp pilus assembly protein CpaB
LNRGAPDRALALVDEALEFIETGGARIYESEGHRLKARCIAALGADAAANDAERRFASALVIADRQGALSLALRAATGFAEYCRRRGQREKAGASSSRSTAAIAKGSKPVI